MITIKNIDELRSKVSHKEEIRESSIGNDLTCFCYMIAGSDTFDDDWSRECRGIVFGRDGKVAARPLHKFFNVNERESTQAHNLDWTKVVRVMDKRDGSMIHTVRGDWTYGTRRGFRVKSKKSFDSDVARQAHSLICRSHRLLPDLAPSIGPNYLGLCEEVVGIDATAIFEYTAPDARIVLYYPDIEMRLLHIRDNESGRYWTKSELELIASKYGVRLVDEPVFDVPRDQLGPHLLELAKTAKDIEGWIVQFEDGEMVKLKTAWYMERHRAMTFIRERDIAAMIISNSLDDLKALLVTEGVDIQEILNIETRVLEDLRGLERAVHALAPAEDFKMPRKEFVFKHREAAGPLFHLLMAKYSGYEPNYLEHFEEHMFKQNYGLRQLNLIPSVAEAE